MASANAASPMQVLVLFPSDDDDDAESGKQSEQKGKKPRRGERKGDSNGGGNAQKKRSAAVKDNKVLMSLMMKMILQSHQMHRNASMVLYDVLVLPGSTAMVMEATKQNGIYSKKVQEAGKGHGLGSPHIYTAGGILKGLIKDIGDTNMDMKTSATALLEAWKGATRERRQDEIRFC